MTKESEHRAALSLRQAAKDAADRKAWQMSQRPKRKVSDETADKIFACLIIGFGTMAVATCLSLGCMAVGWCK